MGLERAPDGEQDLAAILVLAVIDPVDPIFDSKVDTAFAKAAQFAVGPSGDVRTNGNSPTAASMIAGMASMSVS